MLIIIIFLGVIAITDADSGIPWHIKLGYQNIDGSIHSNDSALEGIVISTENLFKRQVHSYFSTFAEIAYSSSAESVDDLMKLYHYGLGIKWNFGPTDYDFEPAVDYQYVLNQGSLYLKLGIGYTNSKRENNLPNMGLIIIREQDISAQYGLGYELLGKRTGFFLEYMNSKSDLIDAGLMRAGVNWRF